MNPHIMSFQEILIIIIIGLMAGVLSGLVGSFSTEFRLLMMTGFCGGFTTFSALTLEGMQLLNQGRFVIFFLYFALSVVLGLMATFAGALITQ